MLNVCRQQVFGCKVKMSAFKHLPLEIINQFLVFGKLRFFAV
jgi:hypothetical protein